MVASTGDRLSRGKLADDAAHHHRGDRPIHRFDAGPGPVIHDRTPRDPTDQGRRRDGARRSVRHPVSYTHLRAHETDSYLVCRLLLEKKKKTKKTTNEP